MAVIARVFARRTKYTPTDDLAFVGMPDMFTHPDSIDVSCLFTWDKPEAERLAKEWRTVCADVTIGGPAYDARGDDFVPGKYVREGYVMTSRGCPRKCPFCFVPNREGKLRELPIHDGPWVIDNNLLACSDRHVGKVFDMLDKQTGVTFVGGLDTYALKDWHIGRLAQLGKRLSYLYVAYDMPNDKLSVERAFVKFYEAGLNQNNIGCYVLVGYDGDTPAAADERCEWVFVNGGIPFAMYYRGPDEVNQRKPVEWGKLTQKWINLRVIFSHMKRDGPRYHERFLRGRFAKQGTI